jgi:hypothetical protein
VSKETTVIVELPPRLKRALDAWCKDTDDTPEAVIIDALELHFDAMLGEALPVDAPAAVHR